MNNRARQQLRAIRARRIKLKNIEEFMEIVREMFKEMVARSMEERREFTRWARDESLASKSDNVDAFDDCEEEDNTEELTFPDKPLWTFLPGHFISTADTFDVGLETMVFREDGKIEVVHGLFGRVHVEGVDFANPLDEYTRHYGTVAEAEAGHAEIVRLVEERIKAKEE